MTLGRATDLTPRAMPQRRVIDGLSVRLEPLGAQHVDSIWKYTCDAGGSFAYLRYGPFPNKAALATLIDDLTTRADQPFWAVCPTNQPDAQGWLSLCDIFPVDAAIEIGSIWFSPTLQRSRAARESLFLLMKMAMDDLGCQRLVWRCQTENRRSFDAAERLGFTFEGTWRDAAVVDGFVRSVSWFSILAAEWPDVRQRLEAWCSDANFREDGTPIRSLSEF